MPKSLYYYLRYAEFKRFFGINFTWYSCHITMIPRKDRLHLINCYMIVHWSTSTNKFFIMTFIGGKVIITFKIKNYWTHSSKSKVTATLKFYDDFFMLKCMDTTDSELFSWVEKTSTFDLRQWIFPFIENFYTIN